MQRREVPGASSHSPVTGPGGQSDPVTPPLQCPQWLMQRKSPASQQPTRFSVHMDMNAHVHIQFYTKNTLTTHTHACRYTCPMCVYPQTLA